MENRVNIGELDTKMTLKSVTQTIGTRGEVMETVGTSYNVWAKIERNIDEMITDQNLEARQMLSATTYKIPALTTRWKAEVGAKTYEITSIDPISRISPLNVLTLRAIDG